jgi:hypothetical protein
VPIEMGGELCAIGTDAVDASMAQMLNAKVGFIWAVQGGEEDWDGGTPSLPS